jgi:hypothetical protein
MFCISQALKHLAFKKFHYENEKARHELGKSTFTIYKKDLYLLFMKKSYSLERQPIS